jgi:SAM-dependent methyltransferase
MTVGLHPARSDLERRARQSLGHSNAAIYSMVARAIERRHPGGGLLVDVGCGEARLWGLLRHQFARYVGVDAIRYDGFPADGEFHRVDLDSERPPLPAGTADVVAAVEAIEHLENPRAFVRELTRLAKPGGWIAVTTPNQLSFLSLLTLVVRQRFAAFQDNAYPTHLTALLEIDLRRIAAECGLVEVDVAYSHLGRVPLSPWHYPERLAHRFPRALSDNLLLIGKKPHA